MCEEMEAGGHTCVEVSVDTSIRRLEVYLKKSKKDWSLWPETTQITEGSTEQQYSESKNVKKTIVWTFQATNKQHLGRREDLNMASKGKPEKNKWIYSINSTKQRH